MAVAALCHDGLHGAGAELAERLRHCRVYPAYARQTFEEQCLEQVEPALGRSRLDQPVASGRRVGTPNVLEQGMPAGELRGRAAKEQARSAGVQHRADGAGWGRYVAHVSGGARAADDRVAYGLPDPSVGVVKHPKWLQRQAEHDVHRPRRQDSLALVEPWLGAMHVVRGPERGDEGSQSRKGEASQQHARPAELSTSQGRWRFGRASMYSLFGRSHLARPCCHESHVWLEGRREKSVQTALAGLAVGAISTTPVRTLSSFAILRRLDPKSVPRPPATKTVLSSDVKPNIHEFHRLHTRRSDGRAPVALARKSRGGRARAAW